MRLLVPANHHEQVLILFVRNRLECNQLLFNQLLLSLDLVVELHRLRFEFLLHFVFNCLAVDLGLFELVPVEVVFLLQLSAQLKRPLTLLSFKSLNQQLQLVDCLIVLLFKKFLLLEVFVCKVSLHLFSVLVASLYSLLQLPLFIPCTLLQSVKPLSQYLLLSVQTLKFALQLQT